MSHDLRWRIITVQAIVIAVFLVGAGIALKEARFARDYVHDQLADQRIRFPVAGDPSLKPEEFPDLQQYAGQQVDDGEKARAYANGFIGRHLEQIASGKRYSEVSAEALANPKDANLAQQTQALFQGETLRSMLLNAWGWWTIGTYTQYAAVALLIAALSVLASLVFEVVIVPRRTAARLRAARA